MKNIPRKALRQHMTYLFPLMCTTLSYNKSLHNENYLFLSSIGALVSKKLSRRCNFIVCTLLYFISIYQSKAHFLAYGAAISQAYDSRILLADSKHVLSSIAFKTEIICLFMSDTVQLERPFKLILVGILIISLYFIQPPYCESSDPIEEIKRLFSVHRTNTTKVIRSSNTPSTEVFIDPQTIIKSKEYRAYLKPEKCAESYKIGTFYLLFFISNKKTEFLIFAFLNFLETEATVFLAAAGFLLRWNWEWLGLLCRFDHAECLPFSLGSSAALIYCLKQMDRIL